MRTLRCPSGVASAALIGIFLNAAAVCAATIPVNPGESIAAALAAAAPGDTVLVGCGTYAEQGLQMPPGVMLRSATGEPGCAVLTSGGGESILVIDAASAGARIEGLTFTAIAGGIIAPAKRGGGLFISDASPLISRCDFTDLKADYGGAVYCAGTAAPVITGCSFLRNSANAAGGALNLVGAAAPVLASCLLADNSSPRAGRAVNAALGASPQFIACTIDGGSLAGWDGSAVSLTNSIVVNAAWDVDGSSVPNVSCSDLADGFPGLLADLAGVDGNIAADPLFCGLAGGEQPYTLDQASPCAAAQSICGPMGAFPVACAVSGVDGGGAESLPRVSALGGNYPNPFNPGTTIRYALAEAGPVDLAIYDVAGRRVTRLVDEAQAAGAHEIKWNGRDAAGRSCAAGVYFVRLKTPRILDTDRLSLIK